MTISSSVSKATLNGDGVQTEFSFAFKVWKAGDLEVSITSPDGVNTVVTDWTVELAGSGGTVTYPTVGDPLPLGWMITIRRLMDFLQDVDLVSGTRFDPEVIETALDIATAERQQLLEEISRAVKIGLTSPRDPENVVAEIFYARRVAEDSASAAQEYAGIAVSAMDAAALSETNAAGSEAAAALSAGTAEADALLAVGARDAAILKAEEAAASAAVVGASLNAEAWSASVNYVVGDVVYTTTGKTYRCIDPNINDNPDTDDGSDWFLMTLALGENSNTAYRGDRGKTAYDHSQVAHAPSNAQKNSDITKEEIEAKLTGTISSHAHAVVDTVPVGIVAFYSKTTAPTGWLKANGAAVSRSTYAALFSAIGTTFGAGDGTTTFNIPDLRGEFIRGWDDGRGVDTGRAFMSAQSDEFKSHMHTLEAATDQADYGPKVRGGINATTGTSVTSYVGGTETRPRNIALLACIKY